MRKLIVSMNVSLDGYMAGANCELDWHFSYWNKELADALGMQLEESDTILLGRVTYDAMAGYWPSRATQPISSCEDIAFTDMMNSHEKIVFSNTITAAEWNNSRIIKGHVATETARLKRKPGKNIMVYGSGQLVSTLMQYGLIDEFRLWVHPIVLQQGRPFFGGRQGFLQLKLTGLRAFQTGVALMCYQAISAYSKGRLPSI